MKNKILLYLFIFAALFAIFIYVNDKKILDDQIEKIVSLQKQLDEIEAEKENAKTTGSEDFYDFSLKRNEPAITYFENMGLEAKLLNHKWLIANFTDGEHWGEILLNYYINEDESVEFEALNSFLYPSE